MNAGAFGGECGITFDDPRDGVGVAEANAKLGACQSLALGLEFHEVSDSRDGQDARGFGDAGDAAGEKSCQMAIRCGDRRALHPCARRKMHPEPRRLEQCLAMQGVASRQSCRYRRRGLQGEFRSGGEHGGALLK